MTAAPAAAGKIAEKKPSTAVNDRELAPYLLDDLEVVNFIVNGYHIVKPDLRRGLNEAVAAKLDVMQRNPGDAICDEVPELNEVLDHPAVRGALVSLAGKNFAVMFPPPLALQGTGYALHALAPGRQEPARDRPGQVFSACTTRPP